MAPPQCTLVSNRLTQANGTTVDSALPADQTLTGGFNRYRITNTYTCRTRLTLSKLVTGGDEPATTWTLDAVAPTGALPGPNGTTGSPGATGQDVTPDVTYPLAESGGPLEYAQFVAPNAVLITNSTGSWGCVEVGTDGTTVIPGFADGLNGGVRVPFGSWVRCEAVNGTASLRLVKEVVNTYGGTAVPSDWTLTRGPQGPSRPAYPPSPSPAHRLPTLRWCMCVRECPTASPSPPGRRAMPTLLSSARSSCRGPPRPRSPLGLVTSAPATS